MSQYNLNVATRANHAALLPAVLIATSINEARPSPVININYEDTALLQDGDKAIVQLVTGSNSVFGTTNVIQELTTQFPFLSGKDTKVVCSRYPADSRDMLFFNTPFIGSRVALSARHPDHPRFQGP
jgi:hypothetical protein